MTSPDQRRIAIEAKLDAAVTYMKNAGLHSSISISKLCIYAGINRANLYANYPLILKKISAQVETIVGKERVKENFHKRKTETLESLRKENRLLSIKIKAITYTCIELQVALYAATKKLDQMTSSKKSTSKMAKE